MRAMLMWWRKPYDRGTTLAVADKARGQGRIRKAIKNYAKILQHEPDDHQVHARVAPLFARRRRWADARRSFDAAAGGFMKAGFAEKAMAVLALAAQHFPGEPEYRERLADEQLKRGKRADAVNTLLLGRAQLRGRRQRPAAILLLRQVLALQPQHFDCTLDLANLLSKESAPAEAVQLLADLPVPGTRRERRRLRAAQFRLEPRPGTAWQWLRGR